MEMKKFKYPHLFPLLCLATGLVLASLCLSAGNKPGFMEEYALVRIDMSQLGNNLFTSSNDTSADAEADEEEEDKDKEDEEKDKEDEEKDKDKEDEEDDDGFLGLGRRDISDTVDKAKDKVGDKVDDAKDKVKDKVGEIGNELVDGLAEKLGIKDWYSLHVLTFCQGDYKNETENDERETVVTECSSPSTEGQFSLTETLGGDSLSAGPVDIPIPSGIQRQLAKLYAVLTGVIVFYGLAIGLSALAILASLINLVFPDFHPYRVTMAATATSSLAALSAMLGSAATTIGVGAAAEALRDLGEFVGVRVAQGIEFVCITWAAFGIITAAATYWVWVFWNERKERMGYNTEEFKMMQKRRRSFLNNQGKSYDAAQYETRANRIQQDAAKIRGYEK